jgi:ribosomal protein L10
MPLRSETSESFHGDNGKFMAHHLNRMEHGGRPEALSDHYGVVEDASAPVADNKLLSNESSNPVGFSAIAVAMLSLAAMVGVRMRRRMQPAIALAGSSSMYGIDMSEQFLQSSKDMHVDSNSSSVLWDPLGLGGGVPRESELQHGQMATMAVFFVSADDAGLSNAVRRSGVVVHGGRTATPFGRTSTLAGKEKTVASVQEDIEGADLIYAFDGSGMDIKVIDDLRGRLPENSKARIVKNTLFKRAASLAGYEDANVEQVPAKSNMWIFSSQDDMKATVKAFEGWVKDNSLEKPIKGGYFDKDYVDEKGVEKVKNLPTMPDLMLKLCVSLNLAGSLGIAKAVKAAKGNPRQVAVAISKIEELPKTD